MPTNRKFVLATGQYYHIFNRGVERRPIFTTKFEYQRALDTINFYQYNNRPLRYSKYLSLNQELREQFLNNLQREEKMVNFIVFCLMSNHFHFLLQQCKDGGISKFMANFSNSYTKYFNTKHQRVGPLFQGLFKAVLVETEEQLIHLSRYIHLNPVTGYFAKREELKNYQWSSFSDYIERSSNKGIVNTRLILSFFKIPANYEMFVLDQTDYTNKLKKIEHLAIE